MARAVVADVLAPLRACTCESTVGDCRPDYIARMCFLISLASVLCMRDRGLAQAPTLATPLCLQATVINVIPVCLPEPTARQF